MPEPTPEQRAELLDRLGAALDEIDAQAQPPGEPSLRVILARHAREELAKLRAEEPPSAHRAPEHEQRSKERTANDPHCQGLPQ